MDNPLPVYNFGSLLIESPPDEDHGQFRSYVMELLTEIYGKKPEWLKFSVGQRFERKGIFYREFQCPAGSVDGRIQLHAQKASGISRAIILRGMRSGTAYCHAIHGGIDIEFDCAELVRA